MRLDPDRLLIIVGHPLYALVHVGGLVVVFPLDGPGLGVIGVG